LDSIMGQKLLGPKISTVKRWTMEGIVFVYGFCNFLFTYMIKK
jgi:hypothetical protein